MTPTQTQQEIQRISEKHAGIARDYGLGFVAKDLLVLPIRNALTELATPLVEKIEQLENSLKATEDISVVLTSRTTELRLQLSALEAQNKVLREASEFALETLRMLVIHLHSQGVITTDGRTAINKLKQALSTTQPQPTEKKDEGEK